MLSDNITNTGRGDVVSLHVISSSLLTAQQNKQDHEPQEPKNIPISSRGSVGLPRA